MEALVRELRQAERSLRRDPTFSIAAVLTLALGIGATTAVFSVLYGVLLSPLPYPDGEQLVRLYSTNTRAGVERGQMSPPDFWDFRDQAASLAATSVMFPYEGTLEDEEGNPIRVPAYVVSADFFDVFQTPMQMGRGFLLEEDEPGSPMEVVLSHALWQTLGADPQIVGKAVTVDAGSMTVIGVAGPSFRYPRDALLWAMPGFDWPSMARRGRSWEVVSRVAPGTTVAGAASELDLIANRLESQYPEWNSGVGVEAVPLKETLVGDLRAPLVILMAASLVLLLIAAANVGNLLLARGAARLQETALRAALGASRIRIVLGLFAEAFVAALAGATAGILLAVGAIAAFKTMAPPEVSILGDVAFGWQALGFGAAVTTGATVLFGLLPAVKASSTDLRSLLGDGGRRSTSDAGGHVLRSGLVVAEVGLATALVIASGLLLRSFQNVTRSDPGFDLREGVTFALSPQIGLYGNFEDLQLFYEELLGELRSVPGSGGVALTSSLPLAPQYDLLRPIRILDLPEPEEGDQPQALYRIVSPDFFDVMEIDVVEGRGFTDFDVRDAQYVILVNEAFVRRHLPDGRALDRRIQLLSSQFAPLGRMWATEFEIAGVVEDVRYASMTEEPEPAMYFAFSQAPFRQMTVVLDAAGSDPAGILATARTRLAAVGPEVAMSQVFTVEQVMRASTVSQRFTAALLVAFGLAALGLAVIGIYGVVSYNVAERTGEMAIRMAIGAGPGEVLALIFRQSGKLWGAGVVAGVLGAFLLRRLIATQLYGMSAADPLTFVAAAGVLALVSIAATSVPAVRSTRVEPAITLRGS